jgi:predicted aldo/keto reductase-like oxidoreductase
MARSSTPDPESEDRRRILKGGLLAAAAALGFLPACSDDEAAAADPSAPGSGGGSGSGGSAQSGGGSPPAGPRSMPDASAGAGGSAAVADAGSAGSPGAAGSANPSEPEPAGMTLPRAMLGNTGVSIPIVGLGTSRLGQRNGTPNAADYETMLEVFTAAMDMGIEYIDTGASYGRAEEALGELIPARRDQIFLVTKLYADSRSQAQNLFERSLERLRTDRVDLLHLHSVGERNLDVALSADGAWPFILEQKAAGLTRFVGITGHSNPPNFTRMLATGEVDVMMTIMNFVDHSTYGFSKGVREDALARGVGVMAMKVFGGTESELRPGGGLANSNSPMAHPSNMELAFDETVLPDCMRFVKSLGGITGMVIGVNHVHEIERNIRWAIETVPFSDTEMEAIVRMGETVAPMWAQRYG